jgi:hypothetical protein
MTRFYRLRRKPPYSHTQYAPSIEGEARWRHEDEIRQAIVDGTLSTEGFKWLYGRYVKYVQNKEYDNWTAVEQRDDRYADCVIYDMCPWFPSSFTGPYTIENMDRLLHSEFVEKVYPLKRYVVSRLRHPKVRSNATKIFCAMSRRDLDRDSFIAILKRLGLKSMLDTTVDGTESLMNVANTVAAYLSVTYDGPITTEDIISGLIRRFPLRP